MATDVVQPITGQQHFHNDDDDVMPVEVLRPHIYELAPELIPLPADSGPSYCFASQRSLNNHVPLAVLLPFYNEVASELYATLHDLHLQQQFIQEGSMDYEIRACIVLDGWCKASSSMKSYLSELFQIDPRQVATWDKKLKPGEHRTYVVKKSASRDGPPSPVSFHDPGSPSLPTSRLPELNLTLVVKQDNRKKHNSHRFFLDEEHGFAASTGADLFFLTDGGTKFDKHCLRELLTYMTEHPRAVSCTGRQRVMTKKQQGCEEEEEFFSMSAWYRAAIGYDYEASFGIFNGAFAMFGFLPVIPGPCGLYRKKYLSGAPLQNYFEILEKDPSETGLLLCLLRLAEDRVLSNAPMLWANSSDSSEDRDLHMGLQPNAIFYFQQERDLPTLAAQRRRWILGTVAGYIWMLANFRTLVWASPRIGYAKKILIGLLCTMQLGLYLVVAFAPMIFTLTVMNFLKQFHDFGLTLFSFVMVALVLMFTIRHANPKTEFCAASFTAVSLFSLVSVIAGLLMYAQWMLSSDGTHLIYGPFDLTFYTSWIVIFAMGWPFINNFLYEPSSLFKMLLLLIPFLLFLPILVAWFGLYSFCRFFDFSWGTRPGSQMDSLIHKKEQQKITAAKFLRMSHSMTAIICLANFAFGVWFEYEESHVRTTAVVSTVLFTFSFVAMHLILSFIHASKYRLGRFVRPVKQWIRPTQHPQAKGAKSPVAGRVVRDYGSIETA